MPPKKIVKPRSAKRNVGAKHRRKPTKKDNKGYKTWLLGAVFLLFVLSPFYYGWFLKQFNAGSTWFTDLFITNDYPHYESFNIRIPKPYKVHGIDVSYYQGKINWQEVAKPVDDIKISFAFIKATEGVTLVDARFKRNWREAEKANILRGAYHYFKPKKSGAWQALFFLQTVKPQAGDLLPVVDVEETGGIEKAVLRANLREFLNQVEKKIGAKPIIYSGYKFYIENLEGHFNDYPLWIAHYRQPKLKFTEEKWLFWQHSDEATLSGIKTRTDMNVFNGSESDLEKLLIEPKY